MDKTEKLKVATILLDVEGTVGSKRFVTEVLYPYARQHLGDYVDRHRNDPEVSRALADTVLLSANDTSDPVDTLTGWIAQDRKAPPLKKLQGLIWKRGFEEKAFQGHLFADAVDALRRWHDAGVALAIYSSGSVQAQKLYFKHSVAGNLLPLLRAHFDTDVGAKAEAASYARISQALEQAPADILFLSDSVSELSAARQSGMQALHVVREDTVADARFDAVRTFAALEVERLA